ncbi:L domain-like protein [Meira miltonrushii]|uniref:U2 small nuclear ribonucleoprotein A' n=1 Tax=Meira miltonrushii TaxID=1280837 RepID=A0A316VKI9_9BASI|nr:L domain-like protein [Meira miltonrushii]PWN37568.1 L domain-like protein [Meira miltonrushii]
MKLTPELISRSETSLNTLKDRQLDLRGHKIPAIENLGVTRDQNDTIDLTDNDIRTLTNFPNLFRLHTLILSNNLVNRIDKRLANSLPNLNTLVLTNNALAELSALTHLGRFPKLEFLTLMGNPVTRKQHYREFVVWRCKSLRVLDFQRVKQAERARAKSLMETEDGRPTSLAVSLSESLAGKDGGIATNGVGEKPSSGRTGTFEVGSVGVNGGGSAGRRMTADERKALEEAIENSTSLEEIKRLEDRLRLGYTI